VTSADDSVRAREATQQEVDMRIWGFTFVAAAVGLALSAPVQAKSLRTAPASAAFANAALI
jgi:hypothetical protein